jgi:hypothetical protein
MTDIAPVDSVPIIGTTPSSEQRPRPGRDPAGHGGGHSAEEEPPPPKHDPHHLLDVTA